MDWFGIVPRDAVAPTATVIAALIAAYVALLARRLERELRLLSVELDQSIQVLYRARDAALAMHKAWVFLLSYWGNNQSASDASFTRVAEQSASWAELRGLAVAVGDKALLDLVNLGLTALPRSGDDARDRQRAEAEMRGAFQQVHTRIAELLKIETEKHTRRPWWRRLFGGE